MKKAKKFIALALVLALSASMLAALAGCGDDTADATPTPTQQVVLTPAPTPEPTPEPTEDPDAEPNPFAGEYEVANTNPEGDVSYFEEFIVNDDGTINGVGDASGMTTLEGTIDEDGTFHCEFIRLGGTMDGTIDAEGNLTATGEIRGRNYTMEGTKLG